MRAWPRSASRSTRRPAPPSWPTRRSRAASTSPGRRAVRAPTRPNNGDLVYIPFALDAVALRPDRRGRTGPERCGRDAITKPTLHRRPAHVALRAAPRPPSAGVTYDPNARWSPARATQRSTCTCRRPGSGTRNFWAGHARRLQHHHAAGVRARPLGAHHRPSRFRSTTARCSPGDPDGVGPFSIAQFISQGNGHNDRRHGVALHSLAAGSGSIRCAVGQHRPEPALPDHPRGLQRGEAEPGHRRPAGLRRQPGQPAGRLDVALCNQTLTIRSYGFATLGTAPLGHTCGAVATNLRAVTTL